MISTPPPAKAPDEQKPRTTMEGTKTMADQYVIHELQGSNVWAKDGERLGLVGNVHLDRATGQPAWITVALGLFEGRQYFVPLTGSRRDDDDLYVNYSRKAIEDSPDMDHGGALTPEEEAQLEDYYKSW
ncbi:PRC-barrel domain-containing protein [Arthrobacter caoxuetaonis]|uniref:PRC-barrel domain-containing protein n=1 Tax=Arthrobacter caoxuetaonis TaxID=2886935 RepID=A0A9X1SB76_9MICC|nr:PRC-barrel domain-containing protein [Arthrobacter caoxuetaonis]MCC3281515.1 PRC-barrel domain-containing protein [Arthrobacter caoxuetaonis]MCC3296231.1 PRC-barrel domain-containing protein [Arthrobacter caoxuetaonis]USQ56915.1 PRC-barrel domain-containing protein [Arthrobacter caoxuetaonis]